MRIANIIGKQSDIMRLLDRFPGSVNAIEKFKQGDYAIEITDEAVSMVEEYCQEQCLTFHIRGTTDAEPPDA
jgi:hypothetical protein